MRFQAFFALIASASAVHHAPISHSLFELNVGLPDVDKRIQTEWVQWLKREAGTENHMDWPEFKETFKRVLNKHAVSLTDDQWFETQHEFIEADLDSDGKINVEELESWVSSHTPTVTVKAKGNPDGLTYEYTDA